MKTHKARAEEPPPAATMRQGQLRQLSRATPGVTHLVAMVGVLYSVGVGWLTLSPVPFAVQGSEAQFGILSSSAWIDSSAWTDGRPIEVALNVVMFIPIGFTAGFVGRGAWRFVIPVALTLVIELAQVPLDRISHPRDLVANAVGAALGVALIARVRRHRASNRPTS